MNIFFENISHKVTLTVSLLLGFCYFCILLFAPYFYRDSVVYMAMCSAYTTGDLEIGLNVNLPVLVSALAIPLIKCGMSIQSALLLVSSLLTTLTIFPLYGLLQFFMSKRSAAWGTLIFMLTPSIVRFGFAPLTDGGRWFFLILALYCAFKISQAQKIGYFALLGFSFAGLALVRAEGIVYCAIVGAFLLVLHFYNQNYQIKKMNFKALFIGSIVAFVIMMLFLLPRLIQVYQSTGYWAIDMRQAVALKGLLGLFIEQAEVETNMRAVQNFDFTWFTNQKFHQRFWHNLFTGFNELYLPLATIGAFVLIRTKKWSFYHSTFIAFVVVNAVMFFLMRSNAGRYFFINSVLILPLVVFALSTIYQRLSRANHRKIFIGILCIIAATQVVSAIDNINNRNSSNHKTALALSKLITPNETTLSGSKAPCVAVFGKDYGIGAMSNVNTLTPEHFSYHALAFYPLEELIATGFPKKAVNYPVENLPSDKMYIADYIVILDIEDNTEALETTKTSNLYTQILEDKDDDFIILKRVTVAQ